MIKRTSFLFVIWALFFAACSDSPGTVADQITPDNLISPPGTSSPTETNTTAPTAPPSTSVAQVLNAKYQLGLLDQIRVVQLSEGRYQEGSPGDESYISVFMTDFIVEVDLNADGMDEVAAIVTENYGGSGTFVFLTVYHFINNEPVFLTSIFLDDRPIVNELRIEEGEVFVDAVIHDRNDPACCPSLETTRRYQLIGINLVMSNYSTKTSLGDPRKIKIEAPVDGIEVSGIVRIKGTITIAPFENNLIYRVYDMGGIELSVGPVNVDAADLGAPGTFEKAIDMGNILTNTTVRITVEDINVADGSLYAMDSVILQVR